MKLRSDFLQAQFNIVQDAQTKKSLASVALASATGADIFKQIFLSTESSLTTYIAQSRIQASASFMIALLASIVGFLLILAGVVIAIAHPSTSTTAISPEKLSAFSGILTQFISAIFFYLYNRTLQQIGVFHQSLIEVQELAVSILAGLQIADTPRLEKVLSVLTTKNLK